MSNDTAKSAKSNEKIVAEFQTLRNEQRNLVNHLTNLEIDVKEHKSVIDTLKGVDLSRKCYRLVGGVLCEQTVKDVLPQLNDNREQLEKVITTVADQLTKKGLEINKFREDHKIRLGGQQAGIDRTAVPVETPTSPTTSRNLLVSN